MKVDTKSDLVFSGMLFLVIIILLFAVLKREDIIIEKDKVITKQKIEIQEKSDSIKNLKLNK